MRDLSEVWSGQYAPVRQSDQVYTPTTRRNSASTGASVLNNVLGNKLVSNPQQRRKWVVLTMLCGLSAISVGSLIVGLDPYKLLFKMKVIFTDGGETFLMWRKPDVELYLKVTLFNVTNREEFLSGKDPKLKFKESGPYVYREFLEHENVTFNSNGTMTAIPKHPLTFVPHLSNGKEDDMLVLPNIALMSMGQVAAKKSFIHRTGANLLIMQSGAEPLVQMTAKEFMFGYRTSLLSLGNKFLPSWIKFDKLGLIDRMYDFDGDTSTTFTGETDIRLSGLIDNYNGRPTIPQWAPPCNNITRASDGAKFNSLISNNETLRFFRKSLCRSIELVKTGEETVSGLSGFRYKLKDNSLDNGHFDKDNKCYCRETCLPVGLLDVSQCYYGFPIALSYPHFLDADRSMQDGVEGLNPDPAKHSTYFVINNEAGVPLKLSVKMQINLNLGNLNGIRHVGRFSNLVFPMLWMDITMPGLSAGMVTRFYIYLVVGPVMQAIFTYLFLICGVAFILLSVSSSLLIPRLNFQSDGQVTRRPPPEPVRKPRPGKELDLYYSSLVDQHQQQQQALLKEELPEDEEP